MEFWWAYILIGLVCGIFSALFGVGSGILMIPALVLLFSSSQKSAQGVCLAVMAPMALVGAIRYYMNPQVVMDLKVVAVLAVGAVVGAVIGATIAAWTPGIVLRRLFAVIMIVVAVKMLLTPAVQGDRADGPATGDNVSQEEMK
jgi:uncharacterized membrane protein YfcA